MTRERYDDMMFRLLAREGYMKELLEKTVEDPRCQLIYAEKRGTYYDPCGCYMNGSVRKILKRHEKMIRNEIRQELARVREQIMMLNRIREEELE